MMGDVTTTPLECTLSVARAQDAHPHLGIAGWVLMGRMKQLGDGRHFEVVLSDDDAELLCRALGGVHDA